MGKPNLLEENHISGLASLQVQAKEAQEQAQTVIFIAIDGKAIGFIAVADPKKPYQRLNLRIRFRSHLS